MDIEYFLKERTRFIKYYYDNGVVPFENTKELIEKGIEPYVPPYSEDPEPPFLSEWLDADTALDAVGHAALSMLSSSIQLFINEWVRQAERWSGVKIEVNFKKDGGLRQCTEIFSALDMEVIECPADIDLIEQILLARNRIQHPNQLTSLRVSHSDNDLKKYPKPFFARESEYQFMSESDNTHSWLMPPSVVVTKTWLWKQYHR